MQQPTTAAFQDPAPASGSPVDELPIDVIALIAAQAPFLARLRTVSFVCKRWRVACLRSVRRFRLARSIPAEPAHQQELDACVALFPSLTSVKLSGHALVAALPTTLTAISLTLSPDSLTWLADREACGSPTFLAAYFPRLAAFRFCVESDGAVPCWPLLVAFLARHKTSLTSLKMECKGRLQSVDVS